MSLRRAWFILLTLLALIVSGCSDNGVDSPGSGYVVDTLVVAADALISSAVPSGTFGDSGDLIVGSIVYAEGLRYDLRIVIELPRLPDSFDRSKIFFAELILTSSVGDGSREDTVFAHRIRSDWLEGSVTWLTQPVFDSLPIASGHIDSGKLAISVYPLYLDTADDAGIMLISNGLEQYFYSREALVLNVAPHIIIKRRQ